MSRAILLTGFTAVTLTIAAAQGFAQTLAEPVQWTNLVNAVSSGSQIRKSGGCGGCTDSGAASTQTIVSGDGYVDFTPAFGARLYAGLSSKASVNTDPAAIDFAFSVWPDGGWDVRERNTYRAEGRFVAGDVFRVALTAGRIKYYKNGSLVYSSAASVTLPLAVDVTLIGTTASLVSAAIATTSVNASVAPCAIPVAQPTVQPVQWANLVNATPTGSSIKKTAGCTGCADAGGTSVQTLASGDGYGEFVAAMGSRLYAGLSSTVSASTDPARIDFAFNFWPDGGWDIRERNLYRTEGRFASGDVFRVALIGGRIKYFKNGTLLYTSTAPVTLPLVFDTTLIGAGATISSASMSTASVPNAANTISVLTTAIPNAVLNQPYAASLLASGGCGTYTWTLAAGSLPSGMTLSSAGRIGGTPAVAGTFAFTVRATDSANPSTYDDQGLTLAVPALSAQPIAVTTTSLPGARVGQPYSTNLAASGGSGSLAWSIAAGALPQGFTLDALGTLSGTATAGGRFRFTVRATDAANPSSTADRVLSVNVLAALPPVVYDAISDRTVRAKGPLPALGAAGYAFSDPAFGTRMVRVTDAATRPLSPGSSYRTPSGTHTNAWSADARYLYVTSTDGTPVPFAFDAGTMRATRLAGSSGDGLTLQFANEPTFSYLTPGVMYGTYSGGNLRSIDQFDIESRTYTRLLDLDTVVPNLAGTSTGGLGSSAGPVEKIFAFFGGTVQDRHYYLVVFEKNNPSSRRLLDTVASTVDGVPTNVTLNFKIHAAAIDRSGRYVIVYPTGTDLQAPRSAAPVYVWDTLANTFTATPLVSARAGGHDGYGYGYRVNQDCCTASSWDAAQWQLRSLATPLVSTDLINPVLQPKEVYLADHPSWHNAQPVAMVPFLDANYRYGANTTAWRAWDEEIFAVQTEAAGTGATVWRFAHHRSVVASDNDPMRLSFWYTPRVNVSPDGLWALFTSNWEKTLGTDPRGDAGGAHRQDVFLVELKRP